MLSKKDDKALEIITILAYNDFYKEHRQLFKDDIREYWRQARVYKEQKIREYLWDLEKR